MYRVERKNLEGSDGDLIDVIKQVAAYYLLKESTEIFHQWAWRLDAASEWPTPENTLKHNWLQHSATSLDT